MSFLWQKNSSKKHYRKKRPSPTYDDRSFFVFSKISNAIKRISVPAFFRVELSAGMTVEASLLLPLLMIFFMNITSAVEMIRLHGNLEMALWNTGNKMSVYGTALAGTGENRYQELGDLMKEAGDLAFSYGYIKGEIVKFLGKDYLDASPLTKGAGGLSFLESEIFTSDDTFEIVMTYEVRPKFYMEILPVFRMANHYYSHLWNGYGADKRDDKKETQIVYVAENASVYHLYRECTHLSLTIRETTPFAVVREKNAYGQKYTLCEKCGKGTVPAVIYVGLEGDRYHYRRNCPGLKRTVYSMDLEEAQRLYRPCSRCSR